MSDLRVIRAAEQYRWPSGSYEIVAVLRISPEELARRLGVTLENGVEPGAGPYVGAGLELPSGRRVELVAYRSGAGWRAVELRADAADDRRAAREETFGALKLSPADVEWPLPRGDAG